MHSAERSAARVQDPCEKYVKTIRTVSVPQQAEMALSSSQQADPAVCTASADLCHALSSDALLRHSSTVSPPGVTMT